MRPIIAPVGIGDLKVTKQKLVRYEAGEVAHIEDVLARERRGRTHRRLRQVEEIVVLEEEREEESRRDLQSTERFDVEAESERTIKSETSFEAGLELSAGYGPVSISAFAKFGTNETKEESDTNSTKYAKEVVEKTVSRLLERVREERRQRTLEEVEETNTHGFRNDSAQNVTGVYRWVDKLYRQKVVNYGKRLMYQFSVPEPAAFYLFAQRYNYESKVLPTKPSRPTIPFTSLPLTPDAITRYNYRGLVATSGATGVDPPPAETIVLSKAISREIPSANGTQHFAFTNEDITVPKGYKASIGWYARADTFIEGSPPDVGVFVGDSFIAGRNIYRVQDRAVLPRLASDTPAVHLVGSREVADRPFVMQVPGARPEDPPTTVTMTLDQEKHFIVTQLPSGVLINHLGTGDVWTITVPAFASDPRTSKDALARFAFDIDLDASPGDRDRPMLKMVTTPSVEVTLMERTVRSSFWGKDLNPQFRLGYHALWQVEYIHQIPPLGAPVEPGPGWRRLDRVKRIPNPEEEALAREQSVFDVIVGFIPIVGDAVDIAELLYGLVTGEDKWGNPLGAGDLALLGIGAVLPFVGGSAVRGARRLVQRFAEHADDAAELALRVRRAGLSAEEIALVQELETMIKAGRRPPAELWKKGLDVLRRVPGPQPTIDVLLNAERTGFAHTELQEAYQRYSANQVRGKQPVKKPEDWARSVTRGRPRELFTVLLGPDYAKRLVVREAPPLNLLDIPRPAAYGDELLRAQREVALKSDRLWERLAKLADEPQDAGAASLGLWRRRVSAGRFRILKGNLAEIFSLPIQRAELARIAKQHPTALLVSGVKVRLMQGKKLSPLKLFSDNIVIVKRGNRVEIKAVFEVKAGFKGGQEATEQIFDWIEGRFTDGSQLVLPKGTRLTAANGRTWTTKTELAFTWKPGSKDVPTVTGLASAAERHLITARGSSTLGVDSVMGVASKVVRHELQQSSAELDYLGGDILLGRSSTITPAAVPALR